jgi:signal transduction histidine kinase
MDITEQKWTQTELERIQTQLEQRVRERTVELESTVTELESFSYTLSHDMRAPLRSMHGYAELLADRWGESLGPEGQDYLQRIKNSARRLDTLIQDVLKYSRVSKTPVKTESIDVEKLIASLIGEYPELQPPHAEITIKGPIPRVLGHEGFLTQCISNLLSNAIKFVAPGVQPRVEIQADPQDHTVRLCFEDNGIGIAARDQHRIFRIFQRVNSLQTFEGTGVGLAIVKRAVERLGGQVGVDSEGNNGSRFWLQLPRA